MYVYCVNLAISKSSKQLPNCLKITEASIILIVFIGVICDLSTYIVTISFCSSAWPQKNDIDCLAFSANFANCEFGFHVLRVSLGYKRTFEHPAYLNRDKNDLETYIYWVLGKITVVRHKKFQDLNINKSHFCKSDWIRRNFNWRSRYKHLFNV